MKGTNEDFVKGRFTKYLEKAVERSRRDYLRKEQEHTWKEVPKETKIVEYQLEETEMACVADWMEEIERVSWEPEVIRQQLKEWLDMRLWKSMDILTDLELQVVFAKAFRQLTFVEIGNIMGQKPKKIADSYSYARKKIRKEWKKNENGSIAASGKIGK